MKVFYPRHHFQEITSIYLPFPVTFLQKYKQSYLQNFQTHTLLFLLGLAMPSQTKSLPSHFLLDFIHHLIVGGACSLQILFMDNFGCSFQQILINAFEKIFHIRGMYLIVLQ